MALLRTTPPRSSNTDAYVSPVEAAATARASRCVPAVGGPPERRDLAVFAGGAKAWPELSFNAQLPGYGGHRPRHHFVPARAQPDDAVLAHWRAVKAAAAAQTAAAATPS